MEKIGKYARFIYEDSEEKIVSELLNYLDMYGEKIFEFFDVEAKDNKTIINIIPTKEEFDIRYKNENCLKEEYEVPSWVIGMCNNQGNIIYLSINDYKNTSHSFKLESYDEAFEHYKKTILHEFVHFVNKLFNRKNNCYMSAKYLVEGIATYLSHQRDNTSLNLNYTLEELLDKNINKPCYQGYYLVTKYLVENYSKRFVLELFKNGNKAIEFLKQELYDRAKQYYDVVNK